jgi:DNA repair photolyase
MEKRRTERHGVEPDTGAASMAALAEMPEPPPAIRMPSLARHGRGATLNPAVRFDTQDAAPFDDGWATLKALAEPPKLVTTLTRDASRTAISWNTSPDIGFDRAVNPYRGCEHGCIYCYARPTHAYLGLSPGLDFETKLIFKPEVAELLEKELRKPGYIPRTMTLGSNTDPYQPVERTLKLTRAVLEVLDRFNHPVGIVTKSAGVLRDVDILASMASRNLARVYLSGTTSVPTGVLAAPMIPGLNDAEMEHILQAASRADARHAGYVLLRLPHELRQMFEDWLQTHMPDRARHILNLIRDTRAGALNDARFHHRFAGQGVYADMMGRRFARAARQWGLDEAREGLDCSRFAVPQAAGHGMVQAQMSLF